MNAAGEAENTGSGVAAIDPVGDAGGRSRSIGQSGSSPAAAWGAGGRSTRSAMTEGDILPGASDLFEAMTESFRDGRRRHEAETRMKRIEALNRLLEKHPDFPGVVEELQTLLRKKKWHWW